jgi:hypothetical protein
MSGVVFELGDGDYEYETSGGTAVVYRLVPDRREVGRAMIGPSDTELAGRWGPSPAKGSSEQDVSAVKALARFLTTGAPAREVAATLVDGHFEALCPACSPRVEHVVSLRAPRNQRRAVQCSHGHWVLFQVVSLERGG